MTTLIELKEKLKNIYSEHEVFLRPVFKFLAVFAALLLIKFHVGYMSQINNMLIIIVIALICSFISWSVITVLLSVDIVANVFSVSKELGILMLVIMCVMFLLFFRFTPKEGAFLIIIPLAFFLKIPYFIPLAAGLVCAPVSVVSVTFGTIIYFMLDVIGRNATAINNISGGSTSTASINAIVNMIVSDSQMFLTIIAFIITIFLVYFIKKTSINNSWTIAIIVGGIADFVIILIGTLIFNIDNSIIWIIVGTVLSILLAFIVQFFVFSVDYSRTEHTQFEDDEYYYYVKAVPKINVTAPEMNVKRINAQRRKAVSKKLSNRENKR